MPDLAISDKPNRLTQCERTPIEQFTSTLQSTHLIRSRLSMLRQEMPTVVSARNRFIYAPRCAIEIFWP